MAEGVVENEKPMQEISLAESNTSKDARWNESGSQIIKSKTNSLRRFFKMPQRRHPDCHSESNSPRNLNETFIVMDAPEKDKSDGKEQSLPDQKQKNQKRFSLRLGGTQRQSASTTLDRNVKSETTNFLTTQSKTTLKSSLSSYWGLVFKKGKKNKSTIDGKDDHKAADEDNTTKVPHRDLDKEVEKIAEAVLNEEVHALKISEDSDNN